MIPFDSAVCNRLAKKINEEMLTESKHLLAGAAQDYADYKARAARVRAFETVMTWLKEVESNLRQGK